ncbi:MAG: 3-hydroxyacyl-CoA dehydrogenase family protein [Alphaproteobacteria bacterium]|nr:3-hydroxyacyl-CoA dehydrogenase family protein [Alphaproteobacteria bacterium]
MSGGLTIGKVAVIGAGTMGLSIAALCADRDVPVVLLDRAGPAGDRAGPARAAIERLPGLRPAAMKRLEKAALITPGNVEDDLGRIADCDWVCEAVFEDLATKRDLLARIEAARRAGSVVSTNTSGIPLRDLVRDMPAHLRRDIVVTHFFNPVAVMRLCEIVPGPETAPDVVPAFEAFIGVRLGKGIVHAKDTVNFIANRIGCFFMLMGLHKAMDALEAGASAEAIDAALGEPVGLPSTGLFGLIDLIGLDVMDFVAKNLAANLPQGDAGRAYLRFPAPVQAMAERGQIGRKAGAGFYRMGKAADGSRVRETFDLRTGAWRAEAKAVLGDRERTARDLIVSQGPLGRLAWDVVGGTLAYAAGLVPGIADDIVNVDRAMRWGYAWAKGPFELLDELDPLDVAQRLEAARQPVPAMLGVLCAAGRTRFYDAEGRAFLGVDGRMHPQT